MRKSSNSQPLKLSKYGNANFIFAQFSVCLQNRERCEKSMPSSGPVIATRCNLKRTKENATLAGHLLDQVGGVNMDSA